MGPTCGFLLCVRRRSHQAPIQHLITHDSTATCRLFFLCCVVVVGLFLDFSSCTRTHHVFLTECFFAPCSSRAASRPTPAWRTSRRTCAPTPGRSPTCASTRAATRPSPTPRTGPSTRTVHTPTRYASGTSRLTLSLSGVWLRNHLLHQAGWIQTEGNMNVLASQLGMLRSAELTIQPQN